MKLIAQWAFIFTAFFSIAGLLLLANARLSGSASVDGTTVTLRQVGRCSISVASDHRWTVFLENRWKYSVYVPDNVRFTPKPCSVYSIIYYQGRETILATVQVPGGLIRFHLSKQHLF
jgi:hypothetical protein